MLDSLLADLKHTQLDAIDLVQGRSYVLDRGAHSDVIAGLLS